MDYETFAKLLCDDIGWPADVFVEKISYMIKEQVDKYNQDEQLFELNKLVLKSVINIPSIIQVKYILLINNSWI